MAFQIFILFIVIFGGLFIAESISQKKFSKLTVKRKVYPEKISIGDEFNIELTVENKNKSYIPYVIVKELIPENIIYKGENSETKKGESWHVSRFSMEKLQKRVRTYSLTSTKRGAYNIKNFTVTLGDTLGVNLDTKEDYNFVELIVYPKIKNINTFIFDTTNFQGDNSVRRWIHKDPMYIKGIREYSVDDRMKDIHWKSSLKANKLMVKDYDYTASEQLTMIISCQYGEFFWRDVNQELTERAIDIAVSLGAKASKEGFEVGIWSNCQLIYINEEGSNELKPVRGSFTQVLEYCARMSYVAKYDFESYLENKISHFQREETYVVIAPYMSEKVVEILSKLSYRGYRIKIVDISEDQSIPNIKGIDKIVYKGRKEI